MSSLVAAARPVVRDMFATRWRLIVSVLLIALPVAVISAMTVATESESGSYDVYQARYTVNYHGGQCTQTPDASNPTCDGVDSGRLVPKNHPANFAAYLKDNLPEGATAGLHASLTATISTDHGTSTRTTVQQAPLSTLPSGYSAKLADGTIVLPKQTAVNLGIAAGDRVTVATGISTRTLTVAALSPSYLTAVGSDTLVGDAAEVFATASYPSAIDLPYWTLETTSDLTWDDVLKLNKAGFTVTPGPNVEFAGAPADAPPPTGVPRSFAMTFGEFLFNAVIVAAYAIAAMLIVLLLSPVFALAFSRNTRMMALMSAQGASPRQIRLAVLAYAGLIGLMGGTLGVALGAIGGTVYWKASFADWPLSLAVGMQAVFLLVAVVGAVVSALLPAILVSRNSLAAGIAGAEPDRILGWRKWMAIGPAILLAEVLIIAGIVAAKGTAGVERVYSTATIFTLVTMIGLAASTPALLLGVARMTDRGSLALRSAGRGLLRRSSRVLPVLAATLCLTFVGTLMTQASGALYRSALETEALTTSAPTVVVQPAEQTLVQTTGQATGQGSEQDPEHAPTGENSELAAQLHAVEARVAEQVGSTKSVPLRAIVPAYMSDDGIEVTVDAQYRCRQVGSSAYFTPNRPEDYEGANGKSAATDPEAAADCLRFITRYSSSSPIDSLPASALVQKPEEIDLWAMSEEDKTEAQRVLAGGGILVSRGTPLDDGKVSLALWTNMSSESAEITDPIEAAAVLPPSSAIGVVFSEFSVQRLELPTRTMGTAVMLAPGARPDYDADALRQIPQELPDEYRDLIAVYPNTYARSNSVALLGSAALIGVSAAAIMLVIFLAAAGLRRDNATLISIGASPKLTARIAATEAALTTAIGMGAGVVLGHLVVALLSTRDQYSAAGDLIAVGVAPFVRPDWLLLGGVVAVTALAAALAWFIHRPGTTEPEVARRRD